MFSQLKSSLDCLGCSSVFSQPCQRISYLRILLGNCEVLVFNGLSPFYKLVFSAQRGVTNAHNTITVKGTCLKYSIYKESRKNILCQFSNSLSSAIHLFVDTAIPIHDASALQHIPQYLSQLLKHLNTTLEHQREIRNSNVSVTTMEENTQYVKPVLPMRLASDNESRMRIVQQYKYTVLVLFIYACELYSGCICISNGR